jgi:hypothetical protein
MLLPPLDVCGSVQAPGVLVVEDDLLFSPDFLTYFNNNAPLLDIDPTTFILR